MQFSSEEGYREAVMMTMINLLHEIVVRRPPCVELGVGASSTAQTPWPAALFRTCGGRRSRHLIY